MAYETKGVKRKGRYNKTWKDVVESNLKSINLIVRSAGI